MRSDYSLLLLSVWFVGANLADGWFQWFAFGMSTISAITFLLWRYVEYVDAKDKTEWQETWHR